MGQTGLYNPDAGVVEPRSEAAHRAAERAPNEGGRFAGHECRSRPVGERDPEVDDDLMLVPDRGRHEERVGHRVERAAHRRLRRRQLRLEPRALPACGRLGQRPSHRRPERLEALFEHVVGGTRVQGLHHQLFAERAGDEDAGHGGVPGMGDRHGGGAREARHGPVGEDQVGRERPKDRSELGLGRYELRLDREPAVAQRVRSELGVVGRILDDQDPHRQRCLRHRGTSLSSSQYKPNSLTARMNCSKSTGLTM